MSTLMNGSAPTGNRTRGAAPPEDYGRYVRRTFSRAMRGYSPAEVDAHLQMVEGWFSLAGFDRLLQERREELLGEAMEEALREKAAIADQAQRQAEATSQRARREAEATVEHARRDAEATVEQARREAGATLERARREAEATVQQARGEAEATLERARRDSAILLAEASRREEAAAQAEQRFAGIRQLASEILDRKLDVAA